MAEAATQTTALAKSSLSKAQKAALIFLFLEERGAATLFHAVCHLARSTPILKGTHEAGATWCAVLRSVSHLDPW